MTSRELPLRITADTAHWVLDEQQWCAFLEALDRPPSVKSALRELFERPRPT